VEKVGRRDHVTEQRDVPKGGEIKFLRTTHLQTRTGTPGCVREGKMRAPGCSNLVAVSPWVGKRGGPTLVVKKKRKVLRGGSFVEAQEATLALTLNLAERCPGTCARSRLRQLFLNWNPEKIMLRKNPEPKSKGLISVFLCIVEAMTPEQALTTDGY